jgi:hypothetical protein
MGLHFEQISPVKVRPQLRPQLPLIRLFGNKPLARRRRI